MNCKIFNILLGKPKKQHEQEQEKIRKKGKTKNWMEKCQSRYNNDDVVVVLHIRSIRR